MCDDFSKTGFAILWLWQAIAVETITMSAEMTQMMINVVQAHAEASRFVAHEPKVVIGIRICCFHPPFFFGS